VVPVHKVIDEITGIVTEVPLIPNARGVEFRWSLVDVPTAIRRLIVAEDRGTVIFVKYDDGWRIDNSMTSLRPNALSFASPPALPVTPEDAKNIGEDIANEARKAAEVRRKKQEQARIITESETPTEEIAQFNYAQLARTRSLTA
jgi:hypothetical protein